MTKNQSSSDGQAPKNGNALGVTPAREVDPKLLALLVCPLTKTTLHYDAEQNCLISRAAKLAFPIRDGIPIMLPSEARELTLEEL